MANNPIRKPLCSGCPFRGQNDGLVAKVIKGVYIKPGCRYCSAGKRIKVFKAADPKKFVPSWCPRRKTPAELRVYCYKDIMTCHLNYLFEQEGGKNSPIACEYAMRYECKTELTAKGFYDLSQQLWPSDILKFRVYTNEVVEIDDGLKPYYFCIREGSIEVLFSFDRERAWKNQLDRPDLKDEGQDDDS